MTAAGGDPEALTVGQFLDLGYTVLVEEWVRMGSSLGEAMDETRQYAAGFHGIVAGEGHIADTTSGIESRAMQRPATEQNVAPPPSAETFLILESAMKGVGGFSR